MIPITCTGMGRILNTIRMVGLVSLVGTATACGSGASDGAPNAAATSGTATTGATADRPQIVVTTNILGDVVTAALGDVADVEVIMPLGSDPHDFAPSARQAESMDDADLLVVNGAGFEEGMLDIIANAADSGTPIFSFADQLDLIEFTGDHQDDEHGGNGDGSSSSSSGDDPHIWTDPTNIAAALAAMEPSVADLPGVDTAALSSSVDTYLAKLDDLDSTMRETLAVVPQAQRVLVTNHEVFGYFARHFDFDVVGAIIPSLTTNAEPSAADIEDLATTIDSVGIAAVFGETTQSTRLAEVLADEVGGDVQVVELFTESLGAPGSGADTYLTMMQSDADLIAGALAP